MISFKIYSIRIEWDILLKINQLAVYRSVRVQEKVHLCVLTRRARGCKLFENRKIDGMCRGPVQYGVRDNGTVSLNDSVNKRPTKKKKKN